MTAVPVVIVNYGTAGMTLEAVASVLRHEPEGSVEVHVVDNASPGGDAARLAEGIAARGWGERVTLWAEAENHGFGRGNNVVLRALAARQTPPEVVFLLNPDAHLANDAITRLAGALERHPEAAAAGAAVFDPGGAAATAAYRFPTIGTELARVANFGPIDRLTGGDRTSLPAGGEERRVDWVSGAAVMFRFAPLAAVDFFDPAYFLYYEEVDLMRRLAAAAGPSLYVPDAHVVHAAGAATGQTNAPGRRRRPAYLYQSWRRYFVAAKGRGVTLLTALLMLPAGAFNVTHSALRGRQPWLPAGFFADHLRFVVLPLLGRDPRA